MVYSHDTTNASKHSRIAARSPQRSAARAPARPTIDDFSVASTAPPVQLLAFDRTLAAAHEAIAVANHEIYGDPLPPHLAVQAKGRTQGEDPEQVHRIAAEGVAGGGGQLPHLERIQEAFGSHDVTGIQAHTGGAATQASEAIGAEAYATGDQVAFRNQPTLHTAAHEAAHVVQQRGGVQLKGGVGAAGDAYEQHADAVADAVVAGRSAEALLDGRAGSGGASGAVQQCAVQLEPKPKEDVGKKGKKKKTKSKKDKTAPKPTTEPDDGGTKENGASDKEDKAAPKAITDADEASQDVAGDKSEAAATKKKAPAPTGLTLVQYQKLDVSLNSLEKEGFKVTWLDPKPASFDPNIEVYTRWEIEVPKSSIGLRPPMRADHDKDSRTYYFDTTNVLKGVKGLVAKIEEQRLSSAGIEPGTIAAHLGDGWRKQDALWEWANKTTLEDLQKGTIVTHVGEVVVWYYWDGSLLKIEAFTYFPTDPKIYRKAFPADLTDAQFDLAYRSFQAHNRDMKRLVEGAKMSPSEAKDQIRTDEYETYKHMLMQLGLAVAGVATSIMYPGETPPGGIYPGEANWLMPN